MCLSSMLLVDISTCSHQKSTRTPTAWGQLDPQGNDMPTSEQSQYNLINAVTVT